MGGHDCTQYNCIQELLWGVLCLQQGSVSPAGLLGGQGRWLEPDVLQGPPECGKVVPSPRYTVQRQSRDDTGVLTWSLGRPEATCGVCACVCVCVVCACTCMSRLCLSVCGRCTCVLLCAGYVHVPTCLPVFSRGGLLAFCGSSRTSACTREAPQEVGTPSLWHHTDLVQLWPLLIVC